MKMNGQSIYMNIIVILYIKQDNCKLKWNRQFVNLKQKDSGSIENEPTVCKLKTKDSWLIENERTVCKLKMNGQLVNWKQTNSL